MENEVTAAQVLLSDVRDVDIAEAVIRFQQMQTALQANMSTASRVLNLSLIDFLHRRSGRPRVGPSEVWERRQKTGAADHHGSIAATLRRPAGGGLGGRRARLDDGWWTGRPKAVAPLLGQAGQA